MSVPPGWFIINFHDRIRLPSVFWWLASVPQAGRKLPWLMLTVFLLAMHRFPADS
jgi:hypothetical protein